MIAGQAPPTIHHTDHEDDGKDEIDATGLVGAGGAGASFDDLSIDLFFESIDGYAQDNAGSGAIVLDEYGIFPGTGVTQDSRAQINKQNDYLVPRFHWGKNSKLKTRFGVSSATSVTCDFWAIVGNKGTAKHLGFKITGGKLYGTVGNGSAETTVELETLGTGTYNENRAIKFVYTAGSKCEFYIDGVLIGEITTGLPSGIEYSPYILFVELSNPGVAEFKNANLAQWSYFQEA